MPYLILQIYIKFRQLQVFLQQIHFQKITFLINTSKRTEMIETIKLFTIKTLAYDLNRGLMK